MHRFIWVLICITKEFNVEAIETHVFLNEYDAKIAKHESDRNCQGEHHLHRHIIEL